MWWNLVVINVVVTTDKTVWGNTGIYITCFKWKGTSLLINICMHYLWFFIYWQLLIHSFLLVCVWIYHLVSVSGFLQCTQIPNRLINLLRSSFSLMNLFSFVPHYLNNVVAIFMLDLTVFIHAEIKTCAQSKNRFALLFTQTDSNNLTLTVHVSDLYF